MDRRVTLIFPKKRKKVRSFWRTKQQTNQHSFQAKKLMRFFFNQSTNQPINQSTNQPNQPTNQPTNQSTNQSINQPINQTNLSCALLHSPSLQINRIFFYSFSFSLPQGVGWKWIKHLNSSSNNNSNNNKSSDHPLLLFEGRCHPSHCLPTCCQCTRSTPLLLPSRSSLILFSRWLPMIASRISTIIHISVAFATFTVIFAILIPIIVDST